jgi:hypothetical protein
LPTVLIFSKTVDKLFTKLCIQARERKLEGGGIRETCRWLNNHSLKVLTNGSRPLGGSGEHAVGL